MDRVLRVLAIIALLSLVLFIALARVLDTVQQPAMGSGFPSVTDLLLPALPSILVNIIGETSSALCLAVGVVAVVASIQRRQRGWAIGLVALLFVATNGPTLVTEVAGELAAASDNYQVFTFAPYAGLLLSALVAASGYCVTPEGRLDVKQY